jgi:hypothetical protein
MFKLVTIAALSTLAAAGVVVAAVPATTYLTGDPSALSSVGAVAVVVGFLALLVALLERTNRRASGPGGPGRDVDGREDRDMNRVLDELRAVGGSGR